MVDPLFRVPQPPVDLALTPLDDKVGFSLMAICTVLVLVAARFAWREWKRTGSPILFLMILGGAVMGLSFAFMWGVSMWQMWISRTPPVVTERKDSGATFVG